MSAQLAGVIAHAEATGAITIGMENTGGEVRFQGLLVRLGWP